MEIINHECYVSLEVAKLLKQAGFDWRCRKCYNNGVLFDMEADEIRAQVPQHSSYDVLTPTLDIVQKWLREVKLVSVESKVTKWFNRNQTNECSIFWRYIILSIDTSSQEAFDRIIDIDNRLEFNTYEEALEAGIKKAIEIILDGK